MSLTVEWTCYILKIQHSIEWAKGGIPVKSAKYILYTCCPHVFAELVNPNFIYHILCVYVDLSNHHVDLSDKKLTACS